MTRDALTAKIVQEFKQASDAWSPHCRFPGSHKFREYRGKLDYHLDQIEAARDELRAKASHISDEELLKMEMKKQIELKINNVPFEDQKRLIERR